jgi:hypothetical protein
MARAVALAPLDHDGLVPGLPGRRAKNPGMQVRLVPTTELGHGATGRHRRGMPAAQRAAVGPRIRGLDKVRPPGTEFGRPGGVDRQAPGPLPAVDPARGQSGPPSPVSPFSVSHARAEHSRLGALHGPGERHTPVVGLLLRLGKPNGAGPLPGKQIRPVIPLAVPRGDPIRPLKLVGGDPPVSLPGCRLTTAAKRSQKSARLVVGLGLSPAKILLAPRETPRQSITIS